MSGEEAGRGETARATRRGRSSGPGPRPRTSCPRGVAEKTGLLFLRRARNACALPIPLAADKGVDSRLVALHRPGVFFHGRSMPAASLGSASTATTASGSWWEMYSSTGPSASGHGPEGNRRRRRRPPLEHGRRKCRPGPVACPDWFVQFGADGALLAVRLPILARDAGLSRWPCRTGPVASADGRRRCRTRPAGSGRRRPACSCRADAPGSKTRAGAASLRAPHCR